LDKLLEQLLVVTICLFGTSVVGFGLALGWFKAVGRELDREAILFAAKMWGGMFVGGILLFFAFKFL
jgi:hypothetical protein